MKLRTERKWERYSYEERLNNRVYLKLISNHLIKKKNKAFGKTGDRMWMINDCLCIFVSKY